MENPIQGQQEPTSANSEFNAISFLVNQMMGKIATATLVQVLSVTNDGDVSPVGTVSVQPMVNQTDGAGIAEPHGTIYNLPYFRLQGGSNAVILDPQVGDIGMAAFASTDISSVKKNKAVSNPGSRRRFDWADGMYFGGFLNGTPVQYVQFNASGISIVTPNNVVVTAGGNITATAQGNVTATAEGSATVTGTTGMVINGPAGITLNGNTIINGTIGTTSGAHGTGNMSIAGSIIATGEGTFNGGHTVSQHTHTQPPDSHGDTEATTNTPIG